MLFKMKYFFKLKAVKCAEKSKDAAVRAHPVHMMASYYTRLLERARRHGSLTPNETHSCRFHI